MIVLLAGGAHSAQKYHYERGLKTLFRAFEELSRVYYLTTCNRPCTSRQFLIVEVVFQIYDLFESRASLSHFLVKKHESFPRLRNEYIQIQDLLDNLPILFSSQQSTNFSMVNPPQAHMCDLYIARGRFLPYTHILLKPHYDYFRESLNASCFCRSVTKGKIQRLQKQY